MSSNSITLISSNIDCCGVNVRFCYNNVISAFISSNRSNGTKSYSANCYTQSICINLALILSLYFNFICIF